MALYPLLLLAVLLAGPETARAGDSVPGPMPFPADETHAASRRWLAKPVLETRLLDDMEQTNFWSHSGEGKMSFTQERSKFWNQSIRLESSTATGRPGPVAGRPFGEARLRRSFGGEDWRAWNRLSFQVYPHLPGFHAISLLVELHNEGSEKVPGGYGRDGLNFFLLKPDQWNQVVWEIPNLGRDKLASVDFVYRLQGSEPGAATNAVFDLDQLELQKVEADGFEGWKVAPGKISYCQPGYMTGAAKVALAAPGPAKQFKVSRIEGPGLEKVVLTKETKLEKNARGEFQILDFSEISAPGKYVLRLGEIVTPPFEIRDDVWTHSIWNTLNLFSSERCGMAIPGIHGLCHEDARARSGETILKVNGGWHDAGDLSQGLVNTAEAVSAMMDLAETLRHSDPALAGRLLEEALWGLAWVEKTRFPDGSRVSWTTLDYWTDNIPGTADDVWSDVRNSPFDHFTAAAAEAAAARARKEADPKGAQESLRLAKEDWSRGAAGLASPDVELASAGALASVELYKASGEQVYANRACELAEVIVKSHEREVRPWTVPLTGFFYTSPQRARLLRYFHRGHNQAPVTALAELCELFPGHSDWMKWYSAVALHSEFLKASATAVSPYEMVPASIYRLDESADPAFQAQVRQGVSLDGNYFLRALPVWFDLRGNNGVLLSQAKALSAAGLLRNNFELLALAQKQLEWVTGRNPFCQSLMQGEGSDFAPQYSAMSGNITGGLPVGIQTRGAADEPYWPMANCYNYKEVWVHPSTRWLSVLSDLCGASVVSGQVAADSALALDFHASSSNARYAVKAERNSGKFAATLPPGAYSVTNGNHSISFVVMPGQAFELNLAQPFAFSVSSEKGKDGTVMIKVKAEGEGKHLISLRASNLEIGQPEKEFNSSVGTSATLTWSARVVAEKEPWVVVAFSDGNVAQRKELFSGFAWRRD